MKRKPEEESALSRVEIAHLEFLLSVLRSIKSLNDVREKIKAIEAWIEEIAPERRST